MDKKDAMALMRLLSALESLIMAWGMTKERNIPDYLLEQIADSVEALEKEILSEASYGRVPDNQRL
jgi:hypothetical protein